MLQLEARGETDYLQDPREVQIELRQLRQETQKVLAQIMKQIESLS